MVKNADFLTSQGRQIAITATQALETFDHEALTDASSGAITLTLPSAVGIAGKRYDVKRLNSGGNNVVIATTGSETIDGASTQTLSNQYDSFTFVSDGSNWYIL